MTGLREIGEFGLIRLLTDHNLPHPQVILGPGDDAAVLSVGDRWVLYTTDMLIEDVHFTLRTTTPYQLGQKALAVNLSDIAAMGGQPTFAVVSLGLPPNTSTEFAEELYRGMAYMAHTHGARVVGGDTVKSSSLIINVALLGETESGHAVLRNGARPGDVICVTNTLGDSAAGLALLSANMPGPTEKHLVPQPRVKEGRLLVGLATAMIDLSDGLAGDLAHICARSSVGAKIEKELLPISEEVLRTAEALNQDPIQWALRGREDFELLFTVPPGKVPSKIGPSTVHPIGEIVAEPGIRLIDGETITVIEGAYDHFRKRES